MSVYSFVGTTVANLSLDPDEFAELTVPEVADEITAMLAEVAPDVDFFEEDIVMAAVSLTGELDLDLDDIDDAPAE